ncbi:MAG: accessory gene regulator B family protein [Ruminococcus flavefaciens]|nr:accessory gene regulator B family protein [Ruminococcus flavefaciens]MCM1229312.1 accessory gene regulator B family protein [Ruminococcus flavefaciens]
MISFLSRRMAMFLRDNEIVDDETSQVCQYGFEIIISTITGFLLVTATGLCCGELLSALLFYAVFVGVRLFTGGYHASTHFRCKLLLCVCCFFTVITTKAFVDVYTLPIQAVIILAYLVTVLLFSPIEHKNAPIDDTAKKRNRIISIIVSLALSAVGLLGFSQHKKFSMLLSMSLLVVAFLMILSKITERNDSDEQRN